MKTQLKFSDYDLVKFLQDPFNMLSLGLMLKGLRKFFRHKKISEKILFTVICLLGYICICTVFCLNLSNLPRLYHIGFGILALITYPFWLRFHHDVIDNWDDTTNDLLKL